VRPVSIILDRFRRAAAVPAVVGDDLARELAPVFAALDAIEAESEQVRTRAVEAAERRITAGRAETALVSARARERAEGERALAEQARHDSRDAEAAALLTAAEAEAERIRGQGSARAAELVPAVLACVRGDELR
jgi:hypothetical protein